MEDINDKAPEDKTTFKFIRNLLYKTDPLDGRFILGYITDNPIKDKSIHLSSPLVTAG